MLKNYFGFISNATPLQDSLILLILPQRWYDKNGDVITYNYAQIVMFGDEIVQIYIHNYLLLIYYLYFCNKIYDKYLIWLNCIHFSIHYIMLGWTIVLRVFEECLKINKY